MTAEERLKHRQLTVKPLVDAYFAWVKENISKVTAKGKTHNGFSYSINQEKYLRVFLEDGEVPLDNNAAEQSIRSFCVGKKNWVMIDTVAGAEASAIVYSLSETAKERISKSNRTKNGCSCCQYTHYGAFTLKEAGVYFNIGIKKMRRMAELNEGGFALFNGNRWIICRPKFEEYLLKLMKSPSEAAEVLDEDD